MKSSRKKQRKLKRGPFSGRPSGSKKRLSAKRREKALEALTLEFIKDGYSAAEALQAAELVFRKDYKNRP